ncbi:MULTISPECIES: hypothetical protein [unclassified Mesorhizobium]|uniref:hypothetical protein n=1 Tax=unclassified Mesorhizobium TaxID=325217 RepID=UPI000FD7604A|nr:MULTISPECIES: hypothetical protein [unclassified Mesorhizobium]TGQ34697.1 hypothetical protein EN859_025005 [Mesorhizobium sp. M00.F.Ca.ET.216.01.1.1]TIS57571.1 MAG: hypothetical protein E5W91_13490 [Mesorhizobium sp.]TIS88651.1 MAG: hypothetical protein E5W89_20045 [Mesorhizobium sp.]
MIMRIYRGTVFAGNEHLWQDRVEKLSIPWLKKQSGLITFYPGKPMAESGSRTFCMCMIWENVEAIKAAVGPSWKQSIYMGDERALVESSSLEHFEIYQ